MFKKNLKEKKKSFKYVLFRSLFIELIILLAFFLVSFISYKCIYNNVKKEVILEIGTKEIKIQSFFKDGKSPKDSYFVTNVKKIDTSKVSNYNIKIKYNNITRNVNLYIKDTTPPKVKFRNLEKDIDYKINAEDFIVSKSDSSKILVNIINKPKITKFGNYKIIIEVKDIYGNSTRKTCNLKIKLLNEKIEKELGDLLTKEEILLNSNKNGDLINQEILDKINSSPPGEYNIPIKYNNENYNVKIIIKDTTPPELKLRNVTIYYGQHINKDSFIEYVYDKQEGVETNLKTDINNNIGQQEIIIEAIDKSGNKTEQKCTLNIIKDEVGPSINGLTTITINKNTNIDYNSGVSAYDAKDGYVSFSVDSSSVNTAVFGTYYATYYSEDKSGNKTYKKRKIYVEHDQFDTSEKFNEFYNNYLVGKDVTGIVSTIRNMIKYNSNWGGSDPIWYGLTEKKGNCYVHALLVKQALDKQEIPNYLIYTTDKTHYWNLVKINEVYRHFDSTPGNHIMGPATDIEKLSSASMKGRVWDQSIFPLAE